MSAIDRPKVLKLLLEAGADVNRRVDGDITPLLQAVGWLIIPADTVKMLLDAGADINAQDKDRRDVFRLAQDRKEILTILKEYKSKMH
jgi:ankyrin repeat protein